MDERTPRGGVAQTVAVAALVIGVLGVLPIVWGVSAVWQVIGSVVAVLYGVHAARVVWLAAFSTSR